LWLWLKYRVEAELYYYWWTHTYRIKTMGPLASVISNFCNISLLVTGVQPNIQLHEVFEKIPWNQSSHHENYGWFLLWIYMQCLPQIDTFCSEQRWMGHRGRHSYVHEECIGCTVVWRKATLRLKRLQTVKKLSPYYTCLKSSWSVSK